MGNLAKGKGVFLSDEIWNSHTPEQAAQHAKDIISTLKREGIAWVAQQISPGAPWREAVSQLIAGQQAYGHGAIGTWAQGLPAADEVNAVREAKSRGATFHIPNIEAPHEDQAWTSAAFNELLTLALPDGYGVIFTEGAWGRNKDLAKRWRESGFVAIPEAIVSENAQATIAAMLELSAALGWDGWDTAPCVYFTRGAKSTLYNGQITMTGGRYSIFRYGDIDAEDWANMKGWPATQVNPNPDPEPVPPPVLRSATEVAHDIEQLLAEAVKDGGLYTSDARAIISQVRGSWQRRMEFLGQSVSDTQRIVIADRCVDAPDSKWPAVSNSINQTLKAQGL